DGNQERFQCATLSGGHSKLVARTRKNSSQGEDRQARRIRRQPARQRAGSKRVHQVTVVCSMKGVRECPILQKTFFVYLFLVPVRHRQALSVSARARWWKWGEK